MRVVIDTHGILNAVPSTGSKKWLYDAFVSREFIWVLSNEILSECAEIIGKNYGSTITDYVMQSLLDAKNVNRYEPSYKWQLVVSDPDDNKFVDCAVGANVDYLVSNDKQILRLLKTKNCGLRLK